MKLILDIWQYFIDVDILRIVVECTNKHIDGIQDNYSRERDAKLTNDPEMLALIDLLYLAGRLNQIA